MALNKKIHKIELLAPARNAEIGKEAILHGADAVYIGGPSFGARLAAGNSVEDIAALCVFAHLYGARVYVTLNTILWDSELTEAEALVWKLYEVGVDALIVQDLALLKMNLPRLLCMLQHKWIIAHPKRHNGLRLQVSDKLCWHARCLSTKLVKLPKVCVFPLKLLCMVRSV